MNLFLTVVGVSQMVSALAEHSYLPRKMRRHTNNKSARTVRQSPLAPRPSGEWDVGTRSHALSLSQPVGVALHLVLVRWVREVGFVVALSAHGCPAIEPNPALFANAVVRRSTLATISTNVHTLRNGLPLHVCHLQERKDVGAPPSHLVKGTNYYTMGSVYRHT